MLLRGIPGLSFPRATFLLSQFWRHSLDSSSANWLCCRYILSRSQIVAVAWKKATTAFAFSRNLANASSKSLSHGTILKTHFLASRTFLVNANGCIDESLWASPSMVGSNCSMILSFSALPKTLFSSLTTSVARYMSVYWIIELLNSLSYWGSMMQYV